MAHSIEEQRLDQSDNASFNHEKPSEVTEDESHFPTGTRLLVIVISILFAMFLVALVWIIKVLVLANKLTKSPGSHYYRHGSPPHRQPIQCPRRYQLVRQRLPPD